MDDKELDSNNDKEPAISIKDTDTFKLFSDDNINQNEILPSIIQNESLNKNEINNLNSDISNDNKNKINKLQDVNIDNEEDLNLNMNNIENNNYKTKIGIKSKKLKTLKKDYLLDLINFINNSCILTLNNNEKVDSSYSIFKIIKKENKNCCEIIINQDKNNNINSFNDNEEEKDKNKKDENKNVLNEKINNKKNKNIEDEKLEENNKKIHDLNFPIICSLHNNLKCQVLSDYLKHIKEEHDTFNCIECGKEFESFNQLKKHLYKMTFIFNNDEIKGKKCANININAPSFIQKNKNKNKNKKQNPEKKMIKCTECELVFDNVEHMNIHFNEIHKINKTELMKPKNEKTNKRKSIDEKFNEWVDKRLNNEDNKNKNEIIEDNKVNAEEKDIKKQKQKEKSEIKAHKKKEKEKDKELNNIIQDILDSNTFPKKGNKSQKNKNKDDLDDIFDEEKPKKTDENKIKINSNDSATISCNICQRDFFSKQALEKHQKDTNHYDNSFNNLVDNIAKGDKFICNFCGKSFATQQAKESHCNAKNHHEELWCKICNKSFNSKISMDQHCKVKNHYIELYCEICHKLFSSAQAKEQHCKVKNH